MSTPVTKPGAHTGAGLLVKSLEAQGIVIVQGVSTVRSRRHLDVGR